MEQIEKIINGLSSDTATKVLMSRENAALYEKEYEKNLSATELDELKNTLLNRKNDYLQAFKNCFILYYNVLRALREEKAQTSVSYVLDGEQYKGYNYYGDLVCVFDKFGNSTVIEYGLTQIDGVDYYARIDRIYNSDNKQIIFEYVEDMVDGKQVSRLKRITTSTGKSVSYKYSKGQLIELSYSDGTQTTLTYTEEGEIASITDSDKLKTEFSYGSGKITKLINKTQLSAITPNSQTEEEKTITEYTFTYTPNSTNSALNEVCKIAYDDVKEKYVLSTDEATVGGLKGYYYEKSSLVKEAMEIIDRFTSLNGVLAKRETRKAKKEILNLTSLDNFSLSEYDWEIENYAENWNYKVTHAYTNARKINSDGTCTKEVYTDYKYDADYEKILSKTTTEHIAWTDNSQTAKNIVTQENYYYDSDSVLIKTETYVVGEEDKGVETVEYVYDEKGKLLKEISYNSLNPTNKYYIENEYDEQNRIKSQTDALGNKKEYFYNEKTQLLEKEKNSDGGETVYGYDSRENLTAISKVDENTENSNRIRHKYNLPVEFANGDRKYSFGYDYKRRLTSVSSNQYVGFTRNVYDEVGQNKRITTTHQITRLYDEDTFVTEYYPDGRIKEEKYLCKSHYGNPVLPTKVLYTYNDGAKQDLVATIQDNYIGKIHEFVYDNLDRVIEHRQGLYKQEIAYKDTGEISTEKYFNKATEEDEWSQITSNTYTYSTDSRKDLTSLSYGNRTDSYEYDELNRLTKKKSNKAASGYLTEKYGYYKNGDHATDLVNRITYLNDDDIVKREIYTYDKNGNVISVNENGSQAKSYTYDKIGRLIKEKDIDLNKEICYTYDEKGNILVKEVNGEKTYYGYGKGNSNYYDSESERLTKIGNESITYDFIGNPLTYRGATCSWERLNLLKSFTKDGETATFVYDKDKFLSKKTVGEEVTEYVWFDGKLIREKTGEEYVDYYYGADGIEGFKHSSLGTYYYRKNLFGDITEIVDGNGVVKGKYSYTGYGECDIITDENSIASINPFRYRGYYFEKSTGLYYLKSRYYDTEVGRFITFDALENLDPEHIDGLNLYAYCNNNPIMFIDETGEMPKWLSTSLKIVAGVAVIAGCVVGAVFSGGALSVVLAGAALGAASNGISAGISTLVSGGNVHDFANSFLINTITGAISGAVGASSIGVGGQMIINAGLNITSYVGTQKLNGKDPTLGGIVFNGLVGAVAGGIGGNGWMQDQKTSAFIAFSGKNAMKHLFGMVGKKSLGKMAVSALGTGVLGGIYDKFASTFNKNSAFVGA